MFKDEQKQSVISILKKGKTYNLHQALSLLDHTTDSSNLNYTIALDCSYHLKQKFYFFGGNCTSVITEGLDFLLAELATNAEIVRLVHQYNRIRVQLEVS